MGVLQIKQVEVGEVGNVPVTIKLVTTDSLVTLTGAGYLNNQQLLGVNLSPLDLIECIYNYNQSTNSGTFGLFTVSVSNGIYSLSSASISLQKSTGVEASNAVTVNNNAGVITTSSLTTAGGSSYAITWTNKFINSSSVILLSWMGGTNTTANFTMDATAGSGTSTLTIFNNTAATAFNGTIIIGFVVY